MHVKIDDLTHAMFSQSLPTTEQFNILDPYTDTECDVGPLMPVLNCLRMPLSGDQTKPNPSGICESVYLSVAQQQQFVEHVKYLWAGLMHRHNNRLAFLLRIPLQARHEVVRRVRVETGRRLLREATCVTVRYRTHNTIRQQDDVRNVCFYVRSLDRHFTDKWTTWQIFNVVKYSFLLSLFKLNRVRWYYFKIFIQF